MKANVNHPLAVSFKYNRCKLPHEIKTNSCTYPISVELWGENTANFVVVSGCSKRMNFFRQFLFIDWRAKFISDVLAS